MEIRSSSKPEQVPTIAGKVTSKATSSLGVDTAQFGTSNEIRDSLNQLPDSRSERIKKGQELVAKSDYPPSETIKRLSTLLAIHLTRE